MRPTWTIAAPYPEGAAMQLAGALHSRGDLDRLVMPSRRASRAIAALAAASSNGVVRRLNAGAADRPRLFEVAPGLEGLRLLARLGLGPGGSIDPMRAVRRPFDRAAARQSGSDTAAIFLGMPGASEASFLKQSGVFRVLHEVDALPHARNHALDAHYGARAKGERVPRVLADRILREMELAHVVLVPSLVVRSQLSRAGVDEQKILCVPYGVDVARFTASAEKRTIGRRRVLYVGQISYRKGLPTLIDAIRGLDVQLDLVGPVVAPEILRNLPPNARHHPTVPQQDLTSMFARADAFVLPSVEDAFGLVVAEALAAGVPVITTSSVGASELMQEKDGIVLEAGNSAVLREALGAVVPLLPEERALRSGDFRIRIATGKIHDWSSYADAVIAGVEVRRAHQLGERTL